MSESKHLSGLARGLNLRRTSNKIAVSGFSVALVVYLARSVSEHWLVGNPMTVIEALASPLVVFAAWALARELDPDHPWPAALSMATSFVVALWYVPAVLVVITAAAALRMVAGTVGKPLTLFDLALVTIVGYGSGGTLATWSIAIVVFASLKIAPEVGRLRWWSVGALTAGFIVGWYTGDLSPITLTATTAAAALGFLAVAILAAWRVDVSVQTDARSGPVDPKRLAMSRLAAGIIVASATVIGGPDAMWEVAPVGVALIIVATVSIIPALAGPTTDGLAARRSAPLRSDDSAG